jgi:hypothetical protein
MASFLTDRDAAEFSSVYSTQEGAQEGAEPRSWWRRVSGDRERLG